MIDAEAAEQRRLYDAQCKRASSILHVFKACQKATASPRVTTQKPGDDSRMHDWCVGVAWSLRKVGLEGTFILVARLTRQQHSQANSFKGIAGEVSRQFSYMTSNDCEAYFNLHLATFLHELERRRIPDHYNIQPHELAA